MDFVGKAAMSDKSPSNDRSRRENAQIRRIKRLGSYPLSIRYSSLGLVSSLGLCTVGGGVVIDCDWRFHTKCV